MEHSNNVAISVAKNYSSLSRIFRSASGLLPALDLGWTMCAQCGYFPFFVFL
jgi:hypothetical protein